MYRAADPRKSPFEHSGVGTVDVRNSKLTTAIDVANCVTAFLNLDVLLTVTQVRHCNL
jgi:hypothetical protein